MNTKANEMCNTVKCILSFLPYVRKHFRTYIYWLVILFQGTDCTKKRTDSSMGQAPIPSLDALSEMLVVKVK